MLNVQGVLPKWFLGKDNIPKDEVGMLESVPMMMGKQKSEPQLFNYAVNLEKRVRANHPLRRVKEAIDFGFVREEVAHCYGNNGNESVPIPM